MERKLFLIIVVLVFPLFLWDSSVKAQSGTPLVADNVIKVNPRQPPRPTGRYLNNNEKKKKLKVKIRLIASWNCPTYLHYESKPQKERKKLIQKRRKNL